MTDASLGWVFSPRYSPDGAKDRFLWSRQKDSGLWVMGHQGFEPETRLPKSAPPPIGWSADGAWVYALEGKRAAYRGTAAYLGETLTEEGLKISESGAATTLFALPFGEVGGVAVTPDGPEYHLRLLVTVRRVDFVENFDASEDAGRHAAHRLVAMARMARCRSPKTRAQIQIRLEPAPACCSATARRIPHRS